jgi:hypothetical protein
MLPADLPHHVVHDVRRCIYRGTDLDPGDANDVTLVAPTVGRR